MMRGKRARAPHETGIGSSPYGAGAATAYFNQGCSRLGVSATEAVLDGALPAIPA